MLTDFLAIRRTASRIRTMQATFRTLLIGGMACAMPIAAGASPVATAFTQADRQQVQAVFEQQARAATAHDLGAFSAVFATPGVVGDPVTFVARPYQFWGKSELIEHFRETFKGIWKFEPDLAKLRIIPLTPDVAQLYAPTQITLGHTAADAHTAAYLVYEVAVRTPAGWRIGSIVPISAQ
ncbi:YybH family protein [Achromobacter insuavis]|nr:nuclear transport factor 2 family protein [Achromobacter insuavis]